MVELITVLTDKSKGEQTRLFKPNEVFALMQRLEYALPAYQVNVYELIENWNRLKATLVHYATTPLEQLETEEKKMADEVKKKA